MHPDKLSMLGAAGLLQPVMGVAARFRVGVDDVVHALQGRVTPNEAKSAAAALDPDQRKALRELTWPFTCPGCHGLAPELVVCTGCGVKGCEACQIPGRCPSCRKADAEVAVEGERKADERRRQQAERDRGAAEAEAASQRIRKQDAARRDASRALEEAARAPRD